MADTPTSNPDRSDGLGTVSHRHLLLVGAGPGLGMAIAHRFAVGGYRVTLAARSADRLGRRPIRRSVAGGVSLHRRVGAVRTMRAPHDLIGRRERRTAAWCGTMGGGRSFPGALRCGASELTDQRHMAKTLGEHADSLRGR